MPKEFGEFNNQFLELSTKKIFEYSAALEAPVSLERCKAESKRFPWDWRFLDSQGIGASTKSSLNQEALMKRTIEKLKELR